MGLQGGRELLPWSRQAASFDLLLPKLEFGCFNLRIPFSVAKFSQ